MSDYILKHGDSAEILAKLRTESIDALVTDPPAGISFMGKEWDTPGSFVERKADRSNDFDHVAGNHNPENNADKVRDQRGRGRRFRATMTPIFAECLRVMKPGAHGLVWALPRTSHWTATALEDAGFEIRDIVMHLFGTGFPKSLDVSKAIKKSSEWQADEAIAAADPDTGFEGWGTALKPAAEHWILVRKPLDRTVAANVLAYGTGGINIDASRIGVVGERPARERRNDKALDGDVYGSGINGSRCVGTTSTGRFPANVVLDEEAAAMLDAQSGTLTSGKPGVKKGGNDGAAYGRESRPPGTQMGGFGDSGGASRFFYVAKAPKSDKGADNKHPTVKNTRLMEYLIRLITPPGGVVLDPFMGSGSTGVAARSLGFRFIGIEREAEYFETAEKRIGSAA